VRGLVMCGGDAVAVLMGEVRAGEEVALVDTNQQALGTVVARDRVDAFHKLAVRHIDAEGSITKAGSVIGKASQAIAPGSHVHVHNLASARV